MRKAVATAAFNSIRSKDPGARLTAVEALATLARDNYPNAFEALDRATDDPDGRVSHAASAAIDSLGERFGELPVTPVPDQARLDGFKRQLLDADDKKSRRVAEALRRMGDPWWYQAGMQLRIDTRSADSETRRRVVRALGYLGDPRARDYLQLAMADNDQSVRAEAQVAWNTLDAMGGK